jgi:hypothetical protein
VRWFLPSGAWRDVRRGVIVHGPTTLTDHPAPLGVTPVFVDLGAKGAAKALAALRPNGEGAAS